MAPKKSTEEKVKCVKCSDSIDVDDSLSHDDNTYCETCFFDNYFVCARCDETKDLDDSTDVDGDYYCEPCFSLNYSRCYECSEAVSNDDVREAPDGRSYCDTHADELFFGCAGCGGITWNEDMQEDEDGDSVCEDCAGCKTEFQESTTFVKNPSKRYVGLELEYIETKSIRFGSLGQRKEDGSVDPINDEEGEGWEFAMQPANGDKLLDMIDEVCDKFTKAEAFVNKTCGFHVHLDMRETSDQEQRNVYNMWKLMQPVFFGMVSESRIKDNNYCQRVPDSFDKYIDRDRYFALNVCSMSKYGTFEVRLHQGTLDADKIKNWCLLLLSFFDTFTKVDVTKAKYYEIKGLTRREKLLYLLSSIKIPLSLCKYIVRRVKHFAHKDSELFFYKEPMQRSLDLGIKHTAKPEWERWPVQPIYRQPVNDEEYVMPNIELSEYNVTRLRNMMMEASYMSLARFSRPMEECGESVTIPRFTEEASTFAESEQLDTSRIMCTYTLEREQDQAPSIPEVRVIAESPASVRIACESYAYNFLYEEAVDEFRELNAFIQTSYGREKECWAAISRYLVDVMTHKALDRVAVRVHAPVSNRHNGRVEAVFTNDLGIDTVWYFTDEAIERYRHEALERMQYELDYRKRACFLAVANALKERIEFLGNTMTVPAMLNSVSRHRLYLSEQFIQEYDPGVRRVEFASEVLNINEAGDYTIRVSLITATNLGSLGAFEFRFNVNRFDSFMDQLGSFEETESNHIRRYMIDICRQRMQEVLMHYQESNRSNWLDDMPF